MRHHRPSEGLAEELELSMVMSVLLWSPVVWSQQWHGVPTSVASYHWLRTLSRSVLGFYRWEL